MTLEALSSCNVLSRTSPTPESQSLGELEDAAGETKIELAQLPDVGNGLSLQLVEYSWGSGLGWYARKRITLDADQAAGLASLLTSALTPARTAGLPTRPNPVTRGAEYDGNVIRLFPAFDGPEA
jgi:hypothetical protein